MRKHREIALRLLMSGCKRALTRIRRDFRGKTVYGFVLTPNSGFTSFSVGIAERGVDDVASRQRDDSFSPEMLAKLKMYMPEEYEKYANQKPAQPTLVEASEWAGFGSCWEEFVQINDWLDDNFDQFYDDGYEPEKINQFFESVSIETLKSLKRAKAFKNPIFEDKLLLGIQYSDPSQADQVIRVSSKINTRFWHSQIVAVFEEHVKTRKRKKKIPKRKI